MPDPYATVSAALEQIINTEFAPEQIVATHDRLHESLGTEAIEVGISPMRITPMSGNAVVQETWVFVQFYDMWDKQIDPKQQVDPRRITGFAHRFQQAIERHQAVSRGTNEVWFFEVRSLDFPNDATGNKTRFEATVLARGDNMALLESRG